MPPTLPLPVIVRAVTREAALAVNPAPKTEKPVTLKVPRIVTLLVKVELPVTPIPPALTKTF